MNRTAEPLFTRPAPGHYRASLSSLLAHCQPRPAAPRRVGRSRVSLPRATPRRGQLVLPLGPQPPLTG